MTIAFKLVHIIKVFAHKVRLLRCACQKNSHHDASGLLYFLTLQAPE